MTEKRTEERRDVPEGPDRPRRFIEEKIVPQPLTRRQIARRIVLTAFSGMLFGVLAAACFVVSLPAMNRFLGREPLWETSQITISKDEPDAAESGETEESTTAPEETEPVEDKVRSEIEKYPYSAEDLSKMYSNLRSIVTEADSCLASVHSIQMGTDWFDNPIETTGQYAGIVIARTRAEILILTPREAVSGADSIEVAFREGDPLPGAIKQSDSVMGLAVVSVNAAQMDSGEYDKISTVTLGNSYSMKQGDLVIAVGAPAGIIRSSDYGFLSYVVRSIQTIDGSSRLFYSSTAADAAAGTFLLNTAGELIGWATDSYTQNEAGGMTTIVGISDYKGALELLTNGQPVPYFGIQGQEVSQAMVSQSMPKGIYVTTVVTDGPAYNAGIQPGDIITGLKHRQITSLREFQSQVEGMQPGETIEASVQRSNGKDEYKEIAFAVTVGAR